MIRLCSRFDSVLFTPKISEIASYGNYSRSPYEIIFALDDPSPDRTEEVMLEEIERNPAIKLIFFLADSVKLPRRWPGY